MPFMKGIAPIRRTVDYLNKSNLLLKPYIRIFSINFNNEQESHTEVRDFVFWHLPHLQYKNPEVQVITLSEITPTPFIRVWLDSGRDLILDIDRQSREEIHERIFKSLCRQPEELKEEKQLEQNPANFGTGCSKYCICEIPGQVPCTKLVPLPYKWRGKYKFGNAELDESKYL